MSAATAFDVFFLLLACSIIVLRKPLARLTVGSYNRLPGLTLGRRATRFFEYVVVLVGIGGVLLAVSLLVGTGRIWRRRFESRTRKLAAPFVIPGVF